MDDSFFFYILQNNQIFSRRSAGDIFFLLVTEIIKSREGKSCVCVILFHTHTHEKFSLLCGRNHGNLSKANGEGLWDESWRS